MLTPAESLLFGGSDEHTVTKNTASRIMKNRRRFQTMLIDTASSSKFSTGRIKKDHAACGSRPKTDRCRDNSRLRCGYATFCDLVFDRKMRVQGFGRVRCLEQLACLFIRQVFHLPITQRVILKIAAGACRFQHGVNKAGNCRMLP